MSWTDIEAKWAAMARRVQSDKSRDDEDTVTDRVQARVPSLQSEATEMRVPPSLDRPAA